MKNLKAKAKELMLMGDIKAYIEMLTQIREFERLRLSRGK